jgi:hypothetical protein
MSPSWAKSLFHQGSDNQHREGNGGPQQKRSAAQPAIVKSQFFHVFSVFLGRLSSNLETDRARSTIPKMLAREPFGGVYQCGWRQFRPQQVPYTRPQCNADRANVSDIVPGRTEAGYEARVALTAVAVQKQADRLMLES